MKRYHVSKNLFDKSNFPFSGDATIVYTPLNVGIGTFTLSTNLPADSSGTRDVFLLAGNATMGAQSAVNGVAEGVPRTVTANNGYITIATRYNPIREKPSDYNYMLNKGSTALPYEPYGNEWQTKSPPNYGTGTDAVTNLPVEIFTDGQPVSSYNIKGNTMQSGTPTPSNPVAVNGVGERTANLYNNAETSWTSGVKDDNGNVTGSTTSHFTANFTAVKSNTKYSITGVYASGSSTAARIYFFDSTKTWISRTVALRDNPLIFETPVNCEYIQIQTANGADGSDFNLVEGEYTAQTMPPLEPYGFKIPISSGGVTTNIYLGSVQSTRQIKKLVLTGQESWSYSETTIRARAFLNAAVSSISGTSALCNQAQFISDVSYPDIDYFSINSVGSIIFGVEITGSADAFKAYLQAQYAAGTPVTVWYVLATATTGIVNEPLMKIGDYADSISNATAIPTVEGANSITVDTTVQPSEFSATWTGWHDSSVKEYDGSQWQ